MIRSMTGYGRAEGQVGRRNYTVELRSLNSKQFDLNVRMPSQFREREMELRSWLTQQIQRGKIDLGVFYDALTDAPKVAINKNLLFGYYQDLKEVAERIGQTEVDYMSLLLRIPDAMVQDRQEFDEEEWKSLQGLISEALNAFNAYRISEGAEMEADFRLRISNILRTLDEIALPAGARMDRIRAKLKGSLEEFIDADKIDQNRFEQELIYYIEKIDITEEQVRLKSNCEHFIRELNQGEAQGKKLGFISQEIGREINTIGSKANDAEMQRMVVYMKDELEKIKEQSLNVL